MPVPIRATPLQYPRAQSAPSTFQSLLEAIAQYTLYQFDPDYILAVKGTTTPQSQDNNKLWLKTDSVGRPLGLFILYNGKWRQVATGNPFQVAMFAGDWNLFFDATGLGISGLQWDGWAIANGNNGTVNLTNKFLVPGYRCDGAGLWVTNVAGYDAYNGGANTFRIALANLPALAITLNVSDTFAPGTNAFSVGAPGIAGVATWHYPVNNTGPDQPISLIPPFIALGFAQFIGYTT